MKNKDLYSFLRGLNMSEFVSPRVTYFINKNKIAVQQEIQILEEYIKPTDKMKEFLTKKEELAIKHTYQDENGNPKVIIMTSGDGIQTSIYDIHDINNENSGFRIELRFLEQEYKDEIEMHKIKEEKFKSFLEEQSDFSPFMINLQLLDGEKCSQQVMDKIFWMFND